MTLQLIEKVRSENIIIKEIQDLFYNSDKQFTCEQKAILQTKDYTAYAKLSNIIIRNNNLNK
jgi:hypothetical protein